MTIFKKDDYGKVPLNAEICALIEPGKKVLDVGCGPGKLGVALKLKHCFSVGIEADKDLAEIARANYDELIVSDLEEFDGLAYAHGYFDVIVFADILEHLSEPEKTLSMFRSYLAPEGYILVCMPNVANWQVRINLLFGRFDYSPGILDGGHLRFFTQKSAMALIERAGYRVDWIGSRNRVIKLLGKLYKKLFAFQFIIKASKK
ncbi:MAG: class I SAM-dependent methyltransferase [Candidatus Omnitrophota bacterium]|nr:class I SAM-dependent methyltransferase [Candidatus Omnitrophota bacterium]